jgi:mannose-6-phosphate isomerase
MLAELGAPLAFQPVYQTLVWGGRRMERWRPGLPAGPIGESWDLADHAAGMSVVAHGPLAGMKLAELVAGAPAELVGEGFAGGPFPLMVKLIDANQRLSVQVHPDDVLARQLGVGDNGKTECWLVLDDGGSLYQGTRPGVDRAGFAAALAAGTVDETLNHFPAGAGDFFFLEARTVHALGAGCLIYEIQQTCNVTFRVWDWGRLGLDGKPREMHVAQSLETIDFQRAGFGPRRPSWAPHAGGGEARTLVDCEHFSVEERRGRSLAGAGEGRCSVVVCVGGEVTLATAGGQLRLGEMQTALVPAAAGAWIADGRDESARLLVSRPRFSLMGAGSRV